MFRRGGRRRSVFIGAMTIVLLLLLSYLVLVYQLPSQPPPPPETEEPEPVFKIFSKSSTIVITERPLVRTNVHGIFFIAHACTHSAYDFWPKSLQCENCVGLAEEVEIVLAALSQNFFVVAISSLDRKSGCWSHQDIDGVISILNEIVKSFPPDTPVFGLGCSSGGRFLWQLSQYLQKNSLPPFNFDGLIIQSISIPIHHTTIVSQYPPPIIFNPMMRDALMYESILSNNNTLIDSLHYPPELIQFQICYPRPLTTSFMLSRLHHINLLSTEADTIYTLLISHDYVNNAGYFMKDPTDPRNNWQLLLQNNLSNETLSKIILTPGQSPLAKVFNRCWAYHEYCADHVKENLLWLKFIRFRQKQGLPLKPNHD